MWLWMSGLVWPGRTASVKTGPSRSKESSLGFPSVRVSGGWGALPSVWGFGFILGVMGSGRV